MSDFTINNLPLLIAIGLMLAGCIAAQMYGNGSDSLLFDARGGTTWRNHVKVVPDPLGSTNEVLFAERVAKDRCQMTFVHSKGFFVVPEGYEGSVVLRTLVKGRGRLRIALVAGEKIKSYYRIPFATNTWVEVELPLVESKGKLQPADKIADITVWLLAPEGETQLASDAQLFLARATYRLGGAP
ncbi:MAG: hypothetical protein ACUVWX_01155 [Kiritimatiellia bacterium]